MIIANHLPALQVLIPFFGALFSAINKRNNFARIIAIISTFLGFALSIYGLWVAKFGLSYAFGNWPAPIGIEYKLDYLNQPSIVFINGVLLFFLAFCHDLTKSTILNFINKKRQHLFYSILLFAHSGNLGMVSTNDLFNLYVFLEIASLTSYVLMAQGENKQAVVGAFDYLILGTIGATLILIGIGFLLSYTGSLNITDIKERLIGHYTDTIVIAGASFFLIGCILKTAFFPMHFWMMRTYIGSPPVILTYLASISSIIGIYIIWRFIHFGLDYKEIFISLSSFLRPIALIAIIFCSWAAFRTPSIKKIVVYSSATQIGYMFLLLSITGTEQILFQLLIADSINKIALFLIISQYNINSARDHGMWWCGLVIINLICSAGLPLSGMFIVKINILDLLIKNHLLLEFIIVTIGSCISLLYHYKIAISFFSNTNENEKIFTKVNISGLFFITLFQFVTLLFVSQDVNINNLPLNSAPDIQREVMKYEKDEAQKSAAYLNLGKEKKNTELTYNSSTGGEFGPSYILWLEKNLSINSPLILQHEFKITAAWLRHNIWYKQL